MRCSAGSIATAVTALAFTGTIATSTPPAGAPMVGAGDCIVRAGIAIRRSCSTVASAARTAQNPEENQDEQPKDDGEEQDICDQ